ncbi:hypothetical protein ACOSP7_030803 [Xanthoceras sorbifolium]
MDGVFVFSTKSIPESSEELKEKPSYVFSYSKRCRADNGDKVGNGSNGGKYVMNDTGASSSGGNVGFSSSGGKVGGSRFAVLDEAVMENLEVAREQQRPKVAVAKSKVDIVLSDISIQRVDSKL